MKERKARALLGAAGGRWRLRDVAGEGRGKWSGEISPRALSHALYMGAPSWAHNGASGPETVKRRRQDIDGSPGRLEALNSTK